MSLGLDRPHERVDDAHLQSVALPQAVGHRPDDGIGRLPEHNEATLLACAFESVAGMSACNCSSGTLVAPIVD